MFKDNLARVRMERGLSQQQLSDMSGVSQGNISSLEIGSNESTLNNIRMLSKALGVTADFLLSETCSNEITEGITDNEAELLRKINQLDKRGRSLVFFVTSTLYSGGAVCKSL